MAIAGSISPTGGAPRPDPERVATIRYTIVDDAETCAAFAEDARAALAALDDRALTETRSAALDECGLLVTRIRDCVADLNPALLEPRRGLGGLFDSRSKRLKAFRTAYVSTADRVDRTAADIGDRAEALTARGGALDTLWTQTREAIAELDAHINAARDWLVQDTAPAEPEIETLEDLPPVTDAETAELAPAEVLGEQPEQPAVADPSPEGNLAALPHPLTTRLAVLETVRAAALARLPQLRAVQNADWRAPASLLQIRDAVEAWRGDWQEALGLAGKKPKKVRPDGARLNAASSVLADRIAAADRELSAAQARRAELARRGELARLAA